MNSHRNISFPTSEGDASSFKSFGEQTAMRSLDNYKGPATKLMQEAWLGSSTADSDNYSSLVKSAERE